MAAFYHILSPFRISIQDDPELEQQFAGLYGDDFILESSERVERFSPALPDGTSLDWSYDEKTYVLPDAVFRREFPAFVSVFYAEWRELYKSRFKDEFDAIQLTDAGLETYISGVKSLLEQHPLDSREFGEALRALKDNYFFSVEGIAPQVIYRGYPIKTGKHTSMLAFNFMYSYEPMGVQPEEYAAMFMLVEQVRKKYGDQFALARHLFIAGF